MADTGWKSPTTAIGQWTNNNNALSEDGNFATLEAMEIKIIKTNNGTSI